jgi:hypothetical protein
MPHVSMIDEMTGIPISKQVRMRRSERMIRTNGFPWIQLDNLAGSKALTHETAAHPVLSWDRWVER